MMKKRFILLNAAALLLLQASVSFSQNGKTLTLEECMQIALKNNSQMRKAIYQVDRAGANVKGSYSSVLPVVTSSFTSSRTHQAERVDTREIQLVDPTTGQIILDRQDIVSQSQNFNFNQISIRYDQTLFDFGRSWNLIKQSKASFRASSENLVSARHSVYANVRRRYFELLKAMKLEEEFRLAVERSMEQLARTKSMFEIGSVAKIDVYRQEVTLGTDEINLINQRNIVEIAKGSLNIELGRDPETLVHIADIEIDISLPEASLADAISTARENNPSLHQFEYDMDSSEYGMKAAKGRYYPALGFSATYSKQNEVFDRVYGDIGQNFQVSLGMQVNLNIFNGFSDAAEVGRQSANYAIAKENWLGTRRQTDLEVKQAYLNLSAFAQISEINKRNVRSAEEDFRLAQERYRVGAGTLLEVTDSQVSLTRARVQLVSAKYDAMIARAQLEAAMGVVKVNEE
ncbi:MAG: TolC family protein [Caldithrix sp.]|nr:MAG: TolC family protein [Caldithrix sp.]